MSLAHALQVTEDNVEDVAFAVGARVASVYESGYHLDERSKPGYWVIGQFWSRIVKWVDLGRGGSAYPGDWVVPSTPPVRMSNDAYRELVQS